MEMVSRSPADLLERLIGSGFREVVEGADQATCRYPFGSGPGYLQFLTHRRGDGHGRRAQTSTFGGLKAEALAHVDLLLHRPWSLPIEDELGSVDARVVNPVAFLVQKLLTLPKRQRLEKKAKDALYVHDTLAVFAGSLDELGRQAAELVPRLSPRTMRSVRRSAQAALFEEREVAREAVHIARRSRSASITAASFCAACRRGVPRVLAGLGIAWA